MNQPQKKQSGANYALFSGKLGDYLIIVTSLRNVITLKVDVGLLQWSGELSLILWLYKTSPCRINITTAKSRLFCAKPCPVSLAVVNPGMSSLPSTLSPLSHIIITVLLVYTHVCLVNGHVKRVFRRVNLISDKTLMWTQIVLVLRCHCKSLLLQRRFNLLLLVIPPRLSSHSLLSLSYKAKNATNYCKK